VGREPCDLPINLIPPTFIQVVMAVVPSVNDHHNYYFFSVVLINFQKKSNITLSNEMLFAADKMDCTKLDAGISTIR
jgi:hypothetical protein